MSSVTVGPGTASVTAAFAAIGKIAKAAITDMFKIFFILFLLVCFWFTCVHYIIIKNFFEQYNALFLIFFGFFYGIVKKVGSHVDSTSIACHVPPPLPSAWNTYFVPLVALDGTAIPILDGSSFSPGVTTTPVPAV